MILAKGGSEEALWKNKIKEHWTEGKVLFSVIESTHAEIKKCALFFIINIFEHFCFFVFVLVSKCCHLEVENEDQA